jgi:hypothetical protein
MPLLKYRIRPTRTSLTESSRTRRRKEGSGHQIVRQNGKFEWFIKQRGDNGEDLNFFRSLVPYVKQLPLTKKLFLSSRLQNVMVDETGALQDNLLHSWASSTAASPNSFDHTRPTGSSKIRIWYRCNNNQALVNLTHLLQWCTKGGGGWGFNPTPPEIPKFWQNWTEFPVPWKIHS